jgi:ribosomal protein S18 acetylase RimI-like enzyme
MDIIRTAELHDLDAIYEIEHESFPAHIVYSKKDLIKAIKEEKIYCFDVDSMCVGYVWIEFTPSDRSAYIESIAIASSHRHMGLGEKLLLKTFDILRENNVLSCYLHVSNQNRSAVKLYKKHDFIKIDYLEQFYSDHEHAYLMEKLFV